MSEIKAVLFDMDGVLVDAREWHYEALNRALALFGMEISRDDHLVTFDGLPTRKKLEMLSDTRGLPRALHGFLNDLKQRYTQQIVATKCYPIFHIQYAVSRLKQDGYGIAICSNSVRDSMTRMLELSGLTEYADFYLSNEDVQKPKPDPEMYLTAMKRFGFKPDACLIIEDNERGLAAARASGAHVMEVAGVRDVIYPHICSRINALQNRSQEAR